MPDRGLLERAQIRAVPICSHDDGAVWRFDGVRLAQVTFEVDRDAALSVMPEDVSRPVPCYARIIVIEAAHSPVGPVQWAALFVGARHRMMPRNVLVDGLVDGDLSALEQNFGSPYRAGSTDLSREGGRLVATVSGAEGPLTRIVIPALEAVDPAMLRWDPWLGFAERDGDPEVVEYTLRPAAGEAFLSKGATIEVPGELPRDHPWRRLRNLNTISACYWEGAMDVALPQLSSP